MWIRTKAFAVNLTAKIVEVLFRQPSFEESSRINAGGRVRLKENQIGGPFHVLPSLIATKKVIETHFEQVCARGEAGKMPAQFAAVLVRSHHEGQRIPPDNRCNSTLKFQISRVGRLVGTRDCVAVRSVAHALEFHTARTRPVLQFVQKLTTTPRAREMQHLVKSFDPLLNLRAWIVVECDV